MDMRRSAVHSELVRTRESIHLGHLPDESEAGDVHRTGSSEPGSALSRGKAFDRTCDLTNSGHKVTCDMTLNVETLTSDLTLGVMALPRSLIVESLGEIRQ
jgi:hypothetical protein